ncbi:MAG: hypothetical protein RR235_08785 [Oscillospiraceae bacterium]
MKLGDTVSRVPHFGHDSAHNPDKPKTIPGIVVYVHPQRRYYTVEFSFRKDHKFRESYYFQRGAATPPE